MRPRDSRGQSSAAFPAAAQLLGCLYLNPGLRTAVPAKMTVVSDPTEALALAQELSVLLAKDAIKPVEPLLSTGVSTRWTFS